MRRLILGVAMASIAAFVPLSVQAGDQEIANHIEQKLREANREGRLKDFALDLQVTKGVVWLKGHVSSREQENLVLTTAQQAQNLGVVKIIDEICMKPVAQPAMTEQVADKAVVAAAPVTLAAPMLAKPLVDPVTEIPQAKLPTTDEKIANYIQREILESRRAGLLECYHLDLLVNEGTVLLKGDVATAENEQLVLDVATSAKHLGVVKIVDGISVRQVAQAFAAAPVVPVPVVSGPVAVASAPVAPVPVARTPVLVNAQQAIGSGSEVRQAAQQVPDEYYAPAQQQTVGGTANFAGQQVMLPPQRMASMPRQGYQMPMASRPATRVAQAQPIAQSPANLRAPNYTPVSSRRANAQYDHAQMPNYAWPSYAAHPNYGAVTYPKQYSPSAWPYIGPFYPYPQVPLGWRKVTMEWDDGWWHLDFHDH